MEWDNGLGQTLVGAFRLAAVTTLPLTMTPGMALTVFFGSVFFSVLSGAIATRRLAAADPADLF